MSLRSKPIVISTRKTPAGNVTYRVTGTPTPGGRQRKFDTTNYEAAEAQRQIWEAQRLRGDSASRPKLTYLTLLQIREAEAIVEILRTEGLTPMDAVKLGLEAHRAAKSTAPVTIVEVPDYETGFASFLEDTKAHVSDAQYTAYRQRGGRFGKFVGNKKLITAITEQSMKSWLASAKARNGGPIEKKTWNNLYGDVAAVFNFFVRKGWLTKSPFSGMKRYSKKALRRGPKKRLTIEQCQNLMAYLEDHHPDWCCYFAIALFAGIRPDTTNGEMWELARCVERDGIDTYYSNKVFHLTGEITKEGDDRKTHAPANLVAWLKAYPPTPRAIRPGLPKIFTPLRKMFALPHDGLRHTAISAFMSSGKDYSDAADEFGNSEPIIKKHYLHRMSKAEAKQFYAIYPRKSLP